MGITNTSREFKPIISPHFMLITSKAAIRDAKILLRSFWGFVA
jgi:hypothetical protein